MRIVANNYYMIIVLATTSFLYGAKPQIAFLVGDVDAFVKQVSHDTEQQKKFIQFYHDVNKKLLAEGNDARKKGWHHFTSISLERLPIEHPEWYGEIKPFLTSPLAILDAQFDELRTAIRFFLTRYGAWCEFVKKQESTGIVVVQTASSHEQTMWENVKASAVYVADSVQQGFNYIYGKLVV